MKNLPNADSGFVKHAKPLFRLKNVLEQSPPDVEIDDKVEEKVEIFARSYFCLHRGNVR
jgi:hypothetical protein